MYAHLFSIAIPALMALESPTAVTDTSAWSVPPALEAVRHADDNRAGCDQDGRALCYDPGSGRIVLRKTREYMPEIPGLRAAHISLRKDRVTFKYTFR